MDRFVAVKWPMKFVKVGLYLIKFYVINAYFPLLMKIASMIRKYHNHKLQTKTKIIKK